MTARARAAAGFGAAAAAVAVFDLAYGQNQLYLANYNTYALHGAARAGRGALAHDWLAQTANPFPAVSLLVEATHRLGAPWLLYVCHALLFGVYLAAITVIAREAFALRSRQQLVTFVAAAIVAHSILLRAVVQALAGDDWAWALQSGAARQYLLGFVLQPSLFGVLNVAAVAAFLRRRDTAAAVLAAAAAGAHFSYLVTSATLLGAFAVLRALEDPGPARTRLRAALPVLVPGIALLATATVVAVVRFGLGPTDAVEQARRILVDLRFPHHARPGDWLSAGPAVVAVAVQGAAIVLGLVVARRRRNLVVPLAALLGVGVLLTAVQALTGSRALALLFPWRVSVLLVPVCASLVLGWVVGLVPPARAGTLVAAVAVAVALAAAGVGVRRTMTDARAHQADPGLPMTRFVAATADAASLYLIPVDLDDFRMATGARTFVDWKSHPFESREVVEWDRRVQLAREVEQAVGPARCDRAARLASDEGITHVVLPTATPVDCPGWKQIYADRAFAVYLLR